MSAVRAVEMKNVYVAYSGSDKPALYNVSIDIELGRFVLITGPNGAGKTTFIETCLGLLKPFHGMVKLLGVDTRSRRIVEVRKRCGYLPQNFMRSPYESYTAMHVIAMGLASLKRVLEPLTIRDLEKIRRVARDLGIDDLLDKPIGRLSGGQQQRVFLARVFVREPVVLFLDEPFSSIDPEGREYIAEYIRRYVDEKKATAIVVSHVLNPIDRFADIIVEIRNGTIVSIRSR